MVVVDHPALGHCGCRKLCGDRHSGGRMQAVRIQLELRGEKAELLATQRSEELELPLEHGLDCIRLCLHSTSDLCYLGPQYQPKAENLYLWAYCSWSYISAIR